jgi:hypothetical protein
MQIVRSPIRFWLNSFQRRNLLPQAFKHWVYYKLTHEKGTIPLSTTPLSCSAFQKSGLQKYKLNLLRTLYWLSVTKQHVLYEYFILTTGLHQLAHDEWATNFWCHVGRYTKKGIIQRTTTISRTIGCSSRITYELGWKEMFHNYVMHGIVFFLSFFGWGETSPLGH